MPFNPFATIAAIVSMATKDMTLEELCAVNISMQLGADPRGVLGYKKAKHLFDATRDGVPVAHELTREAFAAVVNKRFDEMGP